MIFYFAPLEGLTGYTYRNAFFELYGSECVDKFYAPFISPSANPKLCGKEIADLLPENNTKAMKLIPQILANNPDYFIKAAQQLMELGYTEEINLNLGCPSGTVTSKDKGSGFLRYTDRMDVFFENIFNWRDKFSPSLSLSVKTRIGYLNTDEFPQILDVYNRYPISELTVHPRTRMQMYKGSPDMDAFLYACENSKNPLVYNGDIKSLTDYNRVLTDSNPCAIMLGRGLIANPNLVNELKYGSPLTKDMLIRYVNKLEEAHGSRLNNSAILLRKMKEFWTFIANDFDNPHKVLKLILKSQTYEKYTVAKEEIFANAVLACENWALEK